MALEDDITTLTALVQRMVNESGEPTGFDARSWLGHWLTGVVTALGDRRPLDVLNEPDGLGVVSRLLLRAQSGAFSLISPYGYVLWPDFPLSPRVHSAQRGRCPGPGP